VGQPKTTIELNGKLYDAATGAMVAIPGAPTPAKPAVGKSGQVMDGFIRRHGAPTKAATAVQPTNHHAAKPAARKPQHAQTLMRHVVQKPKPAPVASKVTPSSSAKPQQPSLPTAHLTQRQQRAAQTAQSTAISRFSVSHHHAASVDKKVAHLPVQPHPETPLAVAPPIHAKPQQRATSTTSFHKALETANSHHQASPRPQKLRHRTAAKLGVSRRALNIASATLVVVLLTGFVAYQSAPNISMYVAANRAGFHGNLPGYTPGGFGMSGPVKAGPGVITVSFRSHIDNRSYTVIQKPSNWTSDSLRFNFFKPTDSPTAFLDKGKTIYLYNNGANAAWVNGGVLYQITGNANLSSDQIVSIADSL
jgi:hypothetical protein